MGGFKPQVGPDGIYYIDPEGDSGSWMDYLTRHLPRAVGQTFGEAITPSLTPIGSGQGGRDMAQVQSGPEWLREQTQPGLYDNPLTAGIKGFAGEAQARMTPGTGVDWMAALTGEGAGGALAGAGAVSRAGRAANASQEASTAARRSATSKLQAGAREQGPAGYHTRRGAQTHINREELPGESPYRGPRPTEREFERYRRGTGEGAGIPDEARSGTTSPVGRASRASETANRAAAKRADPVEGHQLNMARYRAGQEIARDLLEREGRLPTPDEIAMIDDPVARQAVEEFVKNQGPVARDLQEGRQIASELGDRRDIASELADRREIQQELQARRDIGNEFAPTQPNPPRPNTMDNWMQRQNAPTQPMPPQPPTGPMPGGPPSPGPPTVPSPTQPMPLPPTNRTATMPPPRGAPLGAPTDRGATMPGAPGPTARDVRQQFAQTQPPTPRPPSGGGIGDVARQEAQRRAARGTPPPADFEANQQLMDQYTRSHIQQLQQLEQLPDYGHWRINTLMQEIFRNNPNISLQEFMELMRKGGGSQGAPPLPF